MYRFLDCLQSWNVIQIIFLSVEAFEIELENLKRTQNMFMGESAKV
jgi:hypothetical protein